MKATTGKLFLISYSTLDRLSFDATQNSYNYYIARPILSEQKNIHFQKHTHRLINNQ